MSPQNQSPLTYNPKIKLVGKPVYQQPGDDLVKLLTATETFEVAYIVSRALNKANSIESK